MYSPVIAVILVVLDIVVSVAYIPLVVVGIAAGAGILVPHTHTTIMLGEAGIPGEADIPEFEVYIISKCKVACNKNYQKFL